MNLVAIFLELDKYLVSIIQQFGFLVYPLLFMIIFFETGIVITPFLPGDSLIFTAGALAAAGLLNIFLLFFIILLAAIIGDTVNYWIGKFIGKTIIERRLVKKEYLDRTQRFYEKYGGKTIVIARFVPIVRTIAPFVAGIGNMSYTRFLSFNIIGGFLWVTLFLFAGFFFGNLPIIKNNLSIVIIIIIALSLVPIVIEYLRSRKRDK